MNEIKKQALGRGLSALLDPSHEEDVRLVQRSSFTLPLEEILPGRHQPRTFFSEEELINLSLSIKEKGVLQPILVRPHPEESGKYEIVAGERRWKAAQKAGLKDIPVLVKEFSDVEALEVGLLENIQRQYLSPIEEAEGYRRLAEEFNHTQDSLSRILGKSRSHISNTLRLLTLSATVKDYLKEGKLSAGHGRALIGTEDPDLLAEMIMEGNLSVREAESLAKKGLHREGFLRAPRQPDPEKEVLKNQISDLLGTAVELNFAGAGGKIVISFKNTGELDQLMQKFNGISPPPPPKYVPKVWVAGD